MTRYFLPVLASAAISLGILHTGCSDQKEDSSKIRIGHFPNVTHVQSLVARNMQRHGAGWFEQRIPGHTFEWYQFNAGPSAMEAIFGRSLDITYVGPSPAINAYVKSKGEEIRIVSGSADGGAALVIQPDSTIKEPSDFIGKTIATPQLGNTQDISCRAWLSENGYKVNMQGAVYEGTGGASGNLDVRLLPTANPDQLALFQQKNIDAVWTVEPWVSRLEMQANAKVLVEEKDVVTTILVSRVKWMQENPELLARIVQAHQELTDWIKQNPEKAQEHVVDELEQLTKTKVSPDLIKNAWNRLVLTNEISVTGLQKFVDDAQKTGFIEQSFDVNQMISPPPAQTE